MKRALLILILAAVISVGCSSSHPSSSSASRPAFEILTDTATCHSTGSVYIEGTVQNNGNQPHTLRIKGESYDENGWVKLGTGTDYVEVDGHGVSRYKVIILDGCAAEKWHHTVVVDGWK